jgi:hypothetical protein
MNRRTAKRVSLNCLVGIALSAIGGAMFWLAIVLLGQEEAFAAGDGERVGQNIGDLLGGWARHLFIGVAALIALKFLFARKFSDLAVFMVAAMLVGGLVFAPNEIAGTIRDIWSTITG